jgi:hypothetical protein
MNLCIHKTELYPVFTVTTSEDLFGEGKGQFEFTEEEWNFIQQANETFVKLQNLLADRCNQKSRYEKLID